MGNCLPKLKKKNKVCPDTSVSGKKRHRTNVSEVLSSSSTQSVRSSSSSSSNAELEMIKELRSTEQERTPVETLIMKKEDTAMDELNETDPAPEVKKPVFFQVDFVQGMPFRMPSRLAERMDQKPEVTKPVQQMVLTEDDELLMDDIINEFEAKERLDKLAEQQMAAQNLREMRLDAIREKARDMRSRPQTRVGSYADGGYGGGEMVERG